MNHSCLYYTTEEDYLNLVVPFFTQALQNNNFCMWVILPYWGVENALSALRAKIKNIDLYIEKGQFEILECSQWYGASDTFDPGEMLDKWSRKEEDVLTKGFEGLWVCGDGSWVKPEDWEKALSYEQAVEKRIHTTKVTALCTYSSKIFDIGHAYLLSFHHGVTVRSDKGRLSILGKI